MLSVAGERAIKVPVVPKASPGQPLCSPVAWRGFITAVRAWAQLGSEDYAWIISQICADPTVNLDPVAAKLTDQEVRIDSVLGASMLSESPAEIKKLFIKAEDHEIEGRTSGLQMAALLGKKINKICDTQFLKLSKTRRSFGSECLSYPSPYRVRRERAPSWPSSRA